LVFATTSDRSGLACFLGRQAYRPEGQVRIARPQEERSAKVLALLYAVVPWAVWYWHHQKTAEKMNFFVFLKTRNTFPD
jgi:hypothetical protein